MSSNTLPVCPKTGSTSPSLTVHLCLHTALLREIGNAPLDTDQVCRQYEVVRHDAATQVAFTRQGYGVALLMDCGMPAWLKTISTICLPSVGPPPAGNGDLKLTPSVRSEMARVLASLVLSRVAEGVSP